MSQGAGGGGNVLIVVIDDVGVEQLPAWTGADAVADAAPTPTIDCLCQRGVRFSQAWSTPLCSPSRAALYTGRLADKTGVGNNVDAELVLDRAEVTVGEVARDAGLATGFVGKWHLDSWSVPGGIDGPVEQGFDSFRGTLGNLREPGAPPPKRGDVQGYDGYWRIVDGELDWTHRYATSVEVDDALDFIDATPDPWLLVLALHAAHVPTDEPPRRLLSEGLDGDATRAEHYRALIEAADTELGRLLGAMDPQTLADTTIVLVADNGTSPEGVIPPDDPERFKGSLFEGGIRVPMVVTGPHVSGPGVSDALVHLVDVLPTVAEIAGAAELLAPLDLDGVSFLDELADPGAAGPARVATAWSPNGGGGGMARAIRDQRYKLIQQSDGGLSLFDLETTPDESVDLLADGGLSDEALAAFDELSQALASPLDLPRYDPPLEQ